MNKILLGLSVGLLTSLSVAQIPMSKYVRTFSSSGATRGYFFLAPVDFTVTGLQVPDETNKGSYVVAIYKLKAAPPPFSMTTPGTPLFYAFVKDAHTCVKVPARVGAFKKGEWCVVLGAAGPEVGTISNSYGASTGANNPSSILGTPIATGLQRCGIQANIGGAKGVGPIWSEVNGPISRIKMTVTGGTVGATSCDFCPPSNGNAALDVCATHPSIIDKELKLEMKSGGTTNTGALMAFGLIRGNNTVPGVGTLCINGIVGIVGYSGAAVGNGPTGTILSLGTIPTATPIGVKVIFQGALRASNPAGLVLTNGLEIVTGR